MNANNEYFLVSEWVKSQLQDYAENRRAPGGFLMSVLENNLSRAVAEADGQNFPAIPQISKWIYNKLPSACWGTPEKVANWLAHEFQIDEQGETQILEVSAAQATCPFCRQDSSVYFRHNEVELRSGCPHAVQAESTGKHTPIVITFHRSAEEKAGKSGPSVYSTPFGEPGERDGIE